MAHAVRSDRSPHELVTVREAAHRLAVSPETIRRRVADGTLSSVRLGPTVRIFAADVDAIFADATNHQDAAS
jgi:excisionase family DNA binding protein